MDGESGSNDHMEFNLDFSNIPDNIIIVLLSSSPKFTNVQVIIRAGIHNATKDTVPTRLGNVV